MLRREFQSAYERDGLGGALRWLLRVLLVRVFQRTAEWTVESAPLVVLDRAAFQAYCRTHGRYFSYGARRQVSIDPPADPDTPEPLASREADVTISKPFVGVVRNATLAGRYPIALTEDRRVIKEATVSASVLVLNVVRSVRSDRSIRPISSAFRSSGGDGGAHYETAVLLYNTWNDGYFHWVTETLARLEGVEQYERETGRRPKLIVGPELTSFQRETLELLGYGENDLIHWNAERATVEELVVPSSRRESNPGQPSPLAYGWLRKRMLERVEFDGVDERLATASDGGPKTGGRPAAVSDGGPTTDGEPRRVFISRDDAPRRRIANESEITAVLSAYGFERHVLSEHSVAENVRLFASADVIVAPHGAGLTDLIYATDATVIELFRETDVRTAYYILCQQLGHRYHYLLCELDGPNLVVDSDALGALLTEILPRPTTLEADERITTVGNRS